MIQVRHVSHFLELHIIMAHNMKKDKNENRSQNYAFNNKDRGSFPFWIRICFLPRAKTSQPSPNEARNLFILATIFILKRTGISIKFCSCKIVGVSPNDTNS